MILVTTSSGAESGDEADSWDIEWTLHGPNFGESADEPDSDFDDNDWAGDASDGHDAEIPGSFRERGEDGDASSK